MTCSRVKYLFASVFSLLFLSPALYSKDISSELKDTGEGLWKNKADVFIEGDMRKCVKWTSETHNTARYPAYSNSPEMTFLGMKLYEVLFNFDDKDLSKVDLVLYSRGDAGDMEREAFGKMVASSLKKISKWLGVEYEKLPIKRFANNKSKVYSRFWKKGDLKALLEWSGSGHSKRDFRAEFLKLELTNTALKSSADSAGTSGAAEEKIKKTPEGDVYLPNVPMVDQGQKGYCAVAVSERVLKYFGTDVDQHLIAQLADTGEKGTNSQQMFDVLKRVGVKFRVKVKEIYENRELETVNKFRRFVKKYNKFAKRAKKEQLDEDAYTSDKNGIKIYDSVKFYSSVDPETYVNFRGEKFKTDYKHFVGDIKEYIDKKLPLMWSVILGVVKEKKANPQTVGGHMRLIIGYNDKTGEIIYSDTWGAGHELKKMPYGEAWAITTGLFCFIPRDR